MRETTARWLACSVLSIIAGCPGAAWADPPPPASAESSSTSERSWVVTPTVRDETRPGRVRCEIEGWVPLDFRQMNAARERVEAKQLLAWYHARVPEGQREDEVETVLREYGLAAGGVMAFSDLQDKFDMKAFAEREDPFLAAVGWCLLPSETKQDLGYLEWVNEMIARIEAVGDEGPPLRMVGLWGTAGNTLEWLEDDRLASVQERSERELARACALPGLDYDDREYLWVKYISDRAGSSSAPEREAWLERLGATEGADPWVLHHGAGVALVKLAWEQRGNKLAYLTSDEQFQAFSKTLIRAREELLAAWAADPRLARTATEMIAVTMGGEGVPGLNEYDWFARATAAQFDFSGAFNRLEYAMRPKWGGSYSTLADLAMSCDREEYYPTWVAVQGTYAFNAILTDSSEHGQDDWLYERPELVRAYLRLIDGVLEHYTGFSQTNRNSYATRGIILATKLGDLEDAERRLRALGDGYNVPTPRYMRLYGYSPQGEVFPFTGPGRATALRAAMADRNGLPGLAIGYWEQTLETVLEATPDDAMAIAAIRDRLRVSQLTNQYGLGGWTDVPLEPSLAGLRGYYEYDLKASGDGYVTLTSHEPNEDFHLYPPIEMGDRYEIEVSMRPAGEVPDKTFVFGVLFNAGLCDWANDPFADYEFTVNPLRNAMGLGRTFGWQGGSKAVEPDEEGWYRFSLAYDEGVITASVNGVPFKQVIRSTLGGPNPRAVNAGISLFKHSGTPVDVKGLRVRKLPEPGDS